MIWERVFTWSFQNLHTIPWSLLLSTHGTDLKPWLDDVIQVFFGPDWPVEQPRWVYLYLRTNISKLYNTMSLEWHLRVIKSVLIKSVYIYSRNSAHYAQTTQTRGYYWDLFIKFTSELRGRLSFTWVQNPTSSLATGPGPMIAADPRGERPH